MRCWTRAGWFASALASPSAANFRRPCWNCGSMNRPMSSSPPARLKANNGILIIDDFGRQMLSPRELLNRWIVPLDRRVDYLTLASGMKFQVPFELMVVFSTNLDPHDLADEAFLRRIQTKVLVENVSAGNLSTSIFKRVAHAEFSAIRAGQPGIPARALPLDRRPPPARLLPQRYLQTGEGHFRIRRPAGPADAVQYRSGGQPVLREADVTATARHSTQSNQGRLVDLQVMRKLQMRAASASGAERAEKGDKLLGGIAEVTAIISATPHAPLFSDGRFPSRP